MSKLRDILRLRLGAKLSLRQINTSLKLSLGAVQKVYARFWLSSHNLRKYFLGKFIALL